MKFTWRLEAPQLLLIAAMFVAGALAWPWLPDRLPVHWGLDGRPDRYGGRFEALFAMPIVSAGLYLLLRLLPRLDPGRANYARFEGAYATFRLAIIALLAAIYAVMHVSFRRAELDMTRIMLPLLGALLIVIGNLLGKVRPNWFFGVRTPWTLSSKQSWNRSHRLAGWLFMLHGLLFILAGAIGTQWAIWAALIILMAGTLGVVVFSYFAWRADPDKIPPAGTLPADGG